MSVSCDDAGSGKVIIQSRSCLWCGDDGAGHVGGHSVGVVGDGGWGAARISYCDEGGHTSGV